MKQKIYVYNFIRHSVGTISVRALDDEEAEGKVRDLLEELHEDETQVDEVILDIKEVEPDGPDRDEEL